MRAVIITKMQIRTTAGGEINTVSSGIRNYLYSLEINSLLIVICAYLLTRLSNSKYEAVTRTLNSLAHSTAISFFYEQSVSMSCTPKA